jgi:ribosomal protein S18 acetylase RimI-like enzyme
MNHQVELNTPPSSHEYNLLRKQIGWAEVDDDLTQTSLGNSSFTICIRDDSGLIGMARIISDRALFYYVQDVIVTPNYQGRGYGHILMTHIESYLSENAQKGATVALLSVAGKEAFYSRYSYLERKGETLGFGMCKFI